MENTFNLKGIWISCLIVLRCRQHNSWYYPNIKQDSTVQNCANSISFLCPPCHISLLSFLFSRPRFQPPLAFHSQWLLCVAVVFVCALLTMAACSPPGSPVCQRWLQQNRLWEQPVSLPWSPAPQPEGQPSIQLSPCPCTHTKAQTHKCPTKDTVTQKAYNAHTLSQ